MSETSEKFEGKNLMDICPQLIPILKPTHGVIVYQEQVMRIVRDLGGYSMGRSDLVRRAMSKKKHKVIEAERQNFVYGNSEENVPGCIANGIDEDVANYIYDKMLSFASYAFNKSHAVAYSVTSYYAAYLKYYWTPYYMCSVINHAENIEKLQGMIGDAVDFGVKILPPNINLSKDICYVTEDKSIRYGLSTIKGVGAAAKTAKQNAPYTNIADFILRGCDNTRAMESLIKAGAFDDAFQTNFSRTTYLQHPNIAKIIEINKKISQKKTFIKNAEGVLQFVNDYENVDEFGRKLQKEGISYKLPKKMPTEAAIQKRINTARDTIEECTKQINDLMSEIENIDDDPRQILIDEMEILGASISGHLIDQYTVSDQSTPIDSVEPGYYTLSGIITELEYKKGINFVLQDKTGSIRCHIFTKDENKYDLHDYDGIEVRGNVNVDEYRSTEDEVVLQMLPRDIRFLKSKKSYRWTTDTADYLTPFQFIRQYKDSNGYPIVIRSLARGCERRCTFLVSEEIEENPEITILRQ